MKMSSQDRGFMACSLALLLLLSACNTVDGVGRDLRSAGETISGGAQKTKQEMR